MSSIAFSSELKILSRKERQELALRLNPQFPVSKNWEDLADEIGFSSNLIENIKAKRESYLHCLLRQWESTGLASVSELLYRLRRIKREDCVELLRTELELKLPKKEFENLMEESKGPFKTACIQEERVDVWEELDEEDKIHSNSPQIYLSYHADSRSEAKVLAGKLEDKGLSVMVDFWFVQERSRMNEVRWRENAIKMARKVLILTSPGYKRSCDRMPSSAHEDLCCIDYDYITRDIVSKNFCNRKTLIVTMSKETVKCVPHGFLSYPPTFWEGKSELPQDLLYLIWDREVYQKPVVRKAPVIPKSIVEVFK